MTLSIDRREEPFTLAGVPGKMTFISWCPASHGKADDAGARLWMHQTWTSERRAHVGFEDEGETIRATVRFDDNCRNGHNTFSVTATIRDRRGRDIGGGCCHEAVAAAFPELAHLIPWHLVSDDGPMHYLANTVYLAGDRDHYGLRKGERRQMVTRAGEKMWTLEYENGPGVETTTPQTDEDAGKRTLPLYRLQTRATGEMPGTTPRLRWIPSYRYGEGKDRDLEAARRAAVWPEATDAELSQEPEALRAALAARLPALMERFRADMTAAGFLLRPDMHPDWKAAAAPAATAD